jgi:hypothetical protein
MSTEVDDTWQVRGLEAGLANLCFRRPFQMLEVLEVHSRFGLCPALPESRLARNAVIAYNLFTTRRRAVVAELADALA